MATIREKGPHQWQAQVRRRGWPNQNATFRTKKDAQIWARNVEREMDQGLFVDQTAGRETTFGEMIDLYLRHVTANRPGEDSRIAETSRLKRFQRDEKDLCAYAVTNLLSDHFEDYRDRRLRHCQKNGKLIAPGTVKRELTLLKRVIDCWRRRSGIMVNPVNTEDVKCPVVHDERDVRLTPDERAEFLKGCDTARNRLLQFIVELGFETGARGGSLLRLAWNDVALDRRTALLRGVKNSRSPGKIVNLTIPSSPRATEILSQLPRTDERVFPLTVLPPPKCSVLSVRVSAICA